MKTTYLVNQTQPDGSTQLSVVSSAQWLAVVQMNKQLPADRRRYFIIDYIQDGDELDRMVIEVAADTYHAWHKEHMAAQRNRRLGRNYLHLSLDVFISTKDGPVCLEDIMAADDAVAEMVSGEMLLADLRRELSAWKPWANDLLDLYLQGKRRSCSSILAEKYGVSERAVRKYKRQFEDFVKKFVSSVPF